MILFKKQVPWRSLWYVTHRLMVMHPHTKYHWPILKDKNVMARKRKYYLKNNYLTLRSKVKVPRRSLQYATHRLMVMHPHTKYNWPIWKDQKSYGPDKIRWEEAEEAEEKIRLKGRHKYCKIIKSWYFEIFYLKLTNHLKWLIYLFWISIIS